MYETVEKTVRPLLKRPVKKDIYRTLFKQLMLIHLFFIYDCLMSELMAQLD